MGPAGLDAAPATLQEARELNIRMGNRLRAGTCAHGLGVVALLQGQPDEARKRLEDALTTFEDLHDPYWSAFTERMMRHVDRIEGNYEAAEKWFRAGLLTSRQHDLPVMTASFLYAYADLALARRRHERAISLAAASRGGLEAVVQEYLAGPLGGGGVAGPTIRAEASVNHALWCGHKPRRQGPDSVWLSPATATFSRRRTFQCGQCLLGGFGMEDSSARKPRLFTTSAAPTPRGTFAPTPVRRPSDPSGGRSTGTWRRDRVGPREAHRAGAERTA
jgi:hypothetical protein